MEKIEIFFKKEVEDFFNALVLELFEKDYFSNLEYAIEYKEKLISFIYANIDFIQNLVRMYITNNEFETFLYMYKTKIETMSFAGCDISGEIDTATEVLCRLEESIL